MRIWRVEQDGCVSHWALARDGEHAIELVTGFLDDVCDGVEPGTRFEPVELGGGEALTIAMDEFHITHTANEWAAIYAHEASYLACSEF